MHLAAPRESGCHTAVFITMRGSEISPIKGEGNA